MPPSAASSSGELTEGPKSRPPQARHAIRAWSQISSAVRKAHRVSILLDFDGTLVRIESRPEDVTVPSSVGEALNPLIRSRNVRVAIISGRRVAELRDLLPFDGLKYYGIHGIESDDGRVVVPKPDTRLALRSTKRLVRIELGGLPGILIEDKGVGFAVHYRLTTQRIQRLAWIRLQAIMAPWSKRLHILAGKKVWEVLPAEVTGKSVGVTNSLSGKWKDALVIYIGDDSSDEEAFRRLPDGITIRVGAKSRTNARYYLKSPAEVVRFLTKLGDFLTSRDA